jgi:hypothetical protein
METQIEKEQDKADVLYEEMKRMVLAQAKDTRYEQHEIDDRRFLDDDGRLIDIEILDEQFPGIEFERHPDYGDPLAVLLPVERRYDRETVCITVDSVSRHYGGPEEGGWWYDAGTVLEYHKILVLYADGEPFLADHELAFLKRLAADWLDEYGDFGTGHRSSMRPRGRDFALRTTFDVPEDWPNARPYYC